MKGGFYIRLAKDGIMKNRKLYFPYILTCICMIMMFYIIYYLGFSADFTTVRERYAPVIPEPGSVCHSDLLSDLSVLYEFISDPQTSEGIRTL